jgi:hypothetical protein
VLKTRGGNTIRQIQFCRRQWLSRKAQNDRKDFLQTLKRHAFTVECSDSKDLVYAFLSLQEVEVLPQPDYALSIEEVYTITSAKLAESSKSLEILGLSARSPLSKLPSWAIDWRVNKSTQGLPLAGSDSNFAASRGYKYRATPSRHPLSPFLTVMGKAIDIVDVVSTKPLSSSPIDPTLVMQELEEGTILQQAYRLYDQAGVDSPMDTEDLYAQCLRVLLAYDRSMDDEHANGPQSFENFIHFIQEYNSHNSTSTSAVKPDQQAVISRLSRMCGRKGKRQLFLSSKHRFGLVPSTTRKGDEICILHGSAVPIALRRVGSSQAYSVIGQCYVDGCMEGEQVDWAEDEADAFWLE